MNTSLLDTALTDNDLRSEWVAARKFILVTVFFLVFVAGTILNSTLLICIIREKLFHNVNHLFILNLAVSDLVIAIGIVFFPMLDLMLGYWPLGHTGCRIVEYTRDVASPVSLFTLAAMSRDRYAAIRSKRIRKRKSMILQPSVNQLVPTAKMSFLKSFKSRAGLIVCLTWVLSLTTLIPITVFGKLVNLPIQKSGRMSCMIDRYEFVQPKILVIVRCALTWVIPLIYIAYNYTFIAIRLWSLSGSMGDNPSLNRSKRKARTRAKLILLLVTLFLFCSFPCHFFLWIFYFFVDNVEQYEAFWNQWHVIGFYLLYVYPTLNPLFLYATSGEFRRLFNKYLFSRSAFTDRPFARSRITSLTDTELKNETQCMSLSGGDSPIDNKQLNFS